MRVLYMHTHIRGALTALNFQCARHSSLTESLLEGKMPDNQREGQSMGDSEQF